MSEAVKVRDESVLDLSTCDREAIHVPGSIQPHGVFFAIRQADFSIQHVSENVQSYFGTAAESLIGTSFLDIVGPDREEALRVKIRALPLRGEPVLLQAIAYSGKEFNALGHLSDDLVIVELEAAPEDPVSEVLPHALHEIIAGFISKVQDCESIEELSRCIAMEIRQITGFDRVLTYRFDSDGTGIVVAEDRNEVFPSLQDHHFPASDIPKQARELYRKNRLRIIPDAGYYPSPIIPQLHEGTGKPLNLSQSALRSVSPIHVEYMRNMWTLASMSVSVLVDGELWGLISCHHSTPKTVPFQARTACDLLAQVFALQIAARTRAQDIERRVELKSDLTRLLARMAESDDFAQGLVSHPNELLRFTRAEGAAVVIADTCHLVGSTPDELQVRTLADWLFNVHKQEVFATDELANEFPEGADYSEKASGLLAISVSQVHPALILWFRPEVIETISWGGDPRKTAATLETSGRINPRKSFETWRETVRRKAVPWLPSEVEAAAELRNAVLGIVLKRAEELAAISEELTRTNQDLQRSNKELEAFSYSVSHDLRAPLRHIVGYAELLKEIAAGKLDEKDLKHADTIIESSEYAGKLVDNLLAFSRMGRTSLTLVPVDMNRLVQEVRNDVMTEANGRQIVWNVDPMPLVEGDVMMLKLAVRNLLSNAIKYTKNREESVIDVKCEENSGQYVFSVEDNGVGFDMRYSDKLFGVFQRLHRWEDFEGTGIGLANVRRIVERHGGKTWAEGAVGKGATFYFSLPKPRSVSDGE